MRRVKVVTDKPRALSRQLRTRAGKFAGSIGAPVKPVVKKPRVKTTKVKTPKVKTPKVKTPKVKTPKVKPPAVPKVKAPPTLGSLAQSARLTSGRLSALKATVTQRFGAKPKRSNGVVSALRNALTSKSSHKAGVKQRGAKLRY